MAHFLFMSIPDRGHIFPSLAVAEELARRGHRITYLTGPTLTGLCASPGITPMAYESEFVEAPMISGATHDGGSELLMLAVDESASMIKAAKEQLSGDLPDAIAYDIATSHAGRVLSQVWERPAIQLTPMFSQNENFSFAEGYEEDGVYSGPSPESMGLWAQRIMELTADNSLDTTFEDFFMGTEGCNLVYLPREFQIHGDTFGPEFSFVGPCVGNRDFIADWTKPDTTLPIVLVSLGTVFNEFTDFFKAAIKAFADLPLHIVMTVGDGVDIDALGPIPPTIEIHRWVRHVAVLEHAVAFVSHGGMSSLMECFEAGKPVVMVPMSPLDRPTARQVRELNLGRTIRPIDVTAERLRDALVDLLADSQATKNAWEMRGHIQRAGGAARAADVAEEYLKTGQPQG